MCESNRTSRLHKSVGRGEPVGHVADAFGLSGAVIPARTVRHESLYAESAVKLDERRDRAARPPQRGLPPCPCAASPPGSRPARRSGPRPWPHKFSRCCLREIASRGGPPTYWVGGRPTPPTPALR